MNFTNLHENFKIRYGKEENPKSVFCATPLFLLGEHTINCDGSCLITTLSCGTALAFSEDSDTFTYQDINSNTSYSCKKNELKGYLINGMQKKVFNTLSYILNGNITGLDMLFECNTDNALLFNHSACAITAAYFLNAVNKDSILKELNYNIPKSRIAGFKASLYSKDGYSLKIGKEETKNILLPFYHKSILLVFDAFKKQEKDFKEAYKDLLTKYPDLPSPKDITNEMISNSANINLISYLKHEEERICSSFSDSNTLFNLINDSGKELISLSENNKLKTLFKTLCELNEVYAVRPVFDFQGVFAIVDTDYIDSIINYVSKEYEKKTGSQPAFYIANTSSSGIEHGLIH